MPSISFPSCLWYLKFVYKTFTSVDVVLTRKWSTYRKYEEICAPQVEEFCFITDNTYFKEEVSLLSFNFWSLHFLMASTIVAILPSLHYDSAFVILQVLEMESSILNYLKFEMTAPTAKCFLRWKNFVIYLIFVTYSLGSVFEIWPNEMACRRFVRAAQGINEVSVWSWFLIMSYNFFDA